MLKRLLILLFIPYLIFSQQRYELLCKNVLIEKSYYYLNSQVGKKETGNNRGIADGYNKAIGNPIGASYCQAGQYWCYYKVCNETKISYNEIPMPRNGLANSTFNYAIKHGAKTNYKAKVHDFIVWKSVNDWTGHIERIIVVGKGGWVTTIGFNTGGGSEFNGDGVAKKKRNITFPLTRIKKIRGLVGVRAKK